MGLGQTRCRRAEDWGIVQMGREVQVLQGLSGDQSYGGAGWSAQQVHRPSRASSRCNAWMHALAQRSFAYCVV